ncbi:MAG TPA: four helix bundle protein [Blastocatellia bacterium]|nr:four helix bundle protein [Blastocatellia bacterium]
MRMCEGPEGFESRTQPLFVEFLGRAKASAGEVRAQLYVALDAGYLTNKQFEELSSAADKCSRQISNFMKYLQNH